MSVTVYNDNNPYTFLDFTVQNLFGDYVTNGKWNQAKYDQYMKARAILPLYSNFADYKIGMKKNEWYMDRYGYDWSNVVQPWNLPGTPQIASGYTALNFVSDNIKRLYR